MRVLSRGLLTAFALLLALWLVLGFWPLSASSRLVLSLCILLAGGVALWRQWRQHLHRRAISETITEHSLPPEDFQGAVVLICGDTAYSVERPDTTTYRAGHSAGLWSATAPFFAGTG